jgi:uncharacterized membrane protein YidH (DUF202 family)
MAGEGESPPSAQARERTALAWNRSGLAVAVCAAVLLRRLWPFDGTGRYIALGLIAVAAIIWAVALLVFTTSAAGGAKFALNWPTVFYLMTVGTVMLAVVVFVLAFFVSA